MEEQNIGADEQRHVDGSLQATVAAFNEAFNRFDAKEVASFWAADGTLISPVGSFGEGRSGVERVYTEDAKTILRGATSTFTIMRARPVGADHVLLDLDHELHNVRMPDGTTGTRKLHTVILAQREGGAWQWLDARPYGFLARPHTVH